MITRRTTLAAGAALAAASGAPAAVIGLGTCRASGRITALVAALRYPASARAIGAAYLEAYPEEAVAENLADAISHAGSVAHEFERMIHDPDAIARAIAETVRADFIRRRTVKLDGWVIAQTEARICALAALT